MGRCDFSAMFRALEDARREEKPILVTAHEWPDGDAIGASCGFCVLLRENGFSAEICQASQLPDCYRSFLLPESAVFSAEEMNTLFSALLVVDSANARRIELGSIGFSSVCIPVLAFDHHPDNEGYAALTCLDSDSCSACSLIFRFAESVGWFISPAAATYLLLGVITDSGCFRFSNANAEAHAIAAKLLNLGADRDRIVNEVYFSKPIDMVKFENALFSGIKTAFDGRFVWVVVHRELLEEYDINLRNTEQLIETIRGIRGVVLAALIKPTSVSGIFRVSLRSKNASVSAGRIARSLKGGGHEMAAGCSIFAQNSVEAEKVLLRHVRKELNHEF